MAVRFIALPMFILLLFAAIALIVLFIKLCSKKPWMAAVAVLVLLLVTRAGPFIHVDTSLRPSYSGSGYRIGVAPTPGYDSRDLDAGHRR